MARRLAAVTVPLLAALLSAAEPVRLAPYPQKIRTFHAVDDPAVPPSLREDPSGPVEARASDGAVWSGGPQGLWRIDDREPARDRRQYFAGRRYLPDDEVLRIVPDAAAGVWVRTRTGVAHIARRPMTLLQKAEVMEQNVRLRHDRYGMLGDSRLAVPGDLATNARVR